MINSKNALTRLIETIGNRMFANSTRSLESAKQLRNLAVGASLVAAPTLGYLFAEDLAKKKNQEIETLLALRQGEPITGLDFSKAPSREQEPLYMDLVADSITSRVMEKLASAPRFRKEAADAATVRALTQATIAALVGIPVMGKVGAELGQYLNPLLDEELASFPISKNITVS